MAANLRPDMAPIRFGGMDLFSAITFSKDRAAQLDALLRSIRECVEGWEEHSLWSVVFRGLFA